MRKCLLLCCASAVLFLLCGCGVIDYYFVPLPEDTAQELYEAGVMSMEQKNYTDAAEYFTKLKDRYPFSPYTPAAELALGDAYFKDGEYLFAADAYKEFEALHPRHEKIPYVLFQIGRSYYESFSSIDRPQNNIDDAIQYLQLLQESFPGSEYAPKAGEYIIKCRRLLAEHEIYVADFYWTKKHYVSAWKRYQYVAENFQELPEISAYARRRAELAYLRFQKERSEEVMDKENGTVKDYFNWL